jgi:hypothetical protein
MESEGRHAAERGLPGTEYPCGEDNTGPASAGSFFVQAWPFMTGVAGLRPAAPALVLFARNRIADMTRTPLASLKPC